MREEFNNFPGSDEFLPRLGQLAPDAQFLDLPHEQASFWQNDPATCVVALDLQVLDPYEVGYQTAGIGKLATELGADEFDFCVVGHREDGKFVKTHLIFRLWWD